MGNYFNMDKEPEYTKLVIEKRPVKPTGWGGPYPWHFFCGPIWVLFSIPTYVLMMLSLVSPITCGVMSGLYGLSLLLMIIFWILLVSSDPTDETIKECLSQKKSGATHKHKTEATGDKPYECEICEAHVSKTAKHCK